MALSPTTAVLNSSIYSQWDQSKLRVYGYYHYLDYGLYLDVYSRRVSIPSPPDPPQTTILTAPERFALVSSLYGPGNLACWLLLLLSVLVSWTLHPTTARRDTITNDFLAVLTLPLVAVAHAFYLLRSHAAARRDLFTVFDRDNVRAAAAIEAPLAVCEAFLPCASLLYCVAARRRHGRRMALVQAVGTLCVAAEVWLGTYGLEYGSAGSALVRPYLFQSRVLLGMLAGWYGVALGVYLVEVAWGVVAGAGAVLWPGRVSRWMAAMSGVAVAGCAVTIKYGAMYPAEWRFHAFRFVPKGVAGMGDLDQVVAVMGGLVTFGFSAWGAYKSMRRGWGREEEVESIILRGLYE